LNLIQSNDSCTSLKRVCKCTKQYEIFITKSSFLYAPSISSP